MTWPLIALAVFAIGLGFVGTPAWPWFQSYLGGHPLHFQLGNLIHGETLSIMLVSSLVVALGIGLGWMLYGAQPLMSAEALDPLERALPGLYGILRNRFYIDELYELSVIRLNAWWARSCDWLDRFVWNGAVQAVSLLVLGLAWLNRFFDEYVINFGFNAACARLRRGGGLASRLQGGQVQFYLRAIGVALVVLVLVLAWGVTP